MKKRRIKRFIIIALPLAVIAGLAYWVYPIALRNYCECQRIEKGRYSPIQFKGIDLAGEYGIGFLAGSSVLLNDDHTFNRSSWGDIWPTIGTTGTFELHSDTISFHVQCYYEGFWGEEPTYQAFGLDPDVRSLEDMYIWKVGEELELSTKPQGSCTPEECLVWTKGL